jgi:UDPglucose--hexose-1-phosphate uridylyltransferase
MGKVQSGDSRDTGETFVKQLAGPHRRYNPLLDEWILCSPHRLQRPWQGQVEPPAPDGRPRYDPTCYLCPGNERAGGARNPRYDTTFVFDNDFPALRPSEQADAVEDDGGLLMAQSAHGVCRVICFSPRHDLTLAQMGVAEIRPVIDTWAEQVAELGQRPDIGYVQVFENKGAMMGCSNPHPHCQVWASGHVPYYPAKKLTTQRAYRERHGRDLLGDYLERELAAGERIVCENDCWVVLVPFWATWPFEAMIVPRRQVTDLPSLTPAERDAAADALRRLCARYDSLFQTSFPYSMGWHGCPTDGAPHPEWRLHAVYYPPLLRSATVRKFLVGYEMTGEPQRDLTAEQAAARLREMPD